MITNSYRKLYDSMDFNKVDNNITIRVMKVMKVMKVTKMTKVTKVTKMTKMTKMTEVMKMIKTTKEFIFNISPYYKVVNPSKSYFIKYPHSPSNSSHHQKTHTAIVYSYNHPQIYSQDLPI